MQLPVDTRAAAGYSAEPLTQRGAADGAGNLTLTSRPVAEGQRWLINYVTLTCDSVAVPTADVYIDEVELHNLFDGTDDATAALAEYNPPRKLRQGQVLVVVFAGADAGAPCSVRIEYDVEAV